MKNMLCWLRNVFRKILNRTWYRYKLGFNPEELWNLDQTIADFVLPRLYQFNLNKNGYPYPCESMDEWDAIIDKMILAFQLVKDHYPMERKSEVDEGLKLFAEYFGALWD